MLNENAQNRIFQRSSRIKNPVQQSFVLKKSFRDTPDRQNITVHIVQETCYAQTLSFEIAATTEFGFLGCVLGSRFTPDYCVDRRRPTLAFSRLFDRRFVLFVEASPTPVYQLERSSGWRDLGKSINLRRRSVRWQDRWWMEVQLRLEICAQTGPVSADVVGYAFSIAS